MIIISCSKVNNNTPTSPPQQQTTQKEYQNTWDIYLSSKLNQLDTIGHIYFWITDKDSFYYSEGIYYPYAYYCYGGSVTASKDEFYLHATKKCIQSGKITCDLYDVLKYSIYTNSYTQEKIMMVFQKGPTKFLSFDTIAFNLVK